MIDAVQRLEDALRAAGVPVEITESGSVIANGRRVSSLKELEGAEVADDVIDKIVVSCCEHELVAAVREHLEISEISIDISRVLSACLLHRGQLSARVSATKARVGAEVVRGNFLVGGEHWARFNAVLSTALLAPSQVEPSGPGLGVESEEVAEIDLSGLALMTVADPPSELDTSLIEEGLEASRRIRLERRHAYAHHVVLTFSGREIAFAPVRRDGYTIIAPFRFMHPGGSTLGAIRLSGMRDPLPIQIESGAREGQISEVWTASLLGFSAITCFDPESDDEGQSQSPPAAPKGSVTPGEFSSREMRHREAPRALRSKWPSHLEPRGPAWSSFSSLVAGHVRRLKEGRSPSSEAEMRAREVGINLGPHETWVRPHSRGAPEGGSIHFRWRCPAALTRFLGECG
jgi:hypothetical protein